MSERISWIETQDGYYLYLTWYDIMDTSEGARMREQLPLYQDWIGHAAIKMFFGYRPDDTIGCKRECTDFSKPSNFPEPIQRDIRAGKFRDVIDQHLLTPAAWAKYEKIEQPVRAEYESIHQQVWAGYKKIHQHAQAKCYTIEQQAWAKKYERIQEHAWAEYKKIQQQAFWSLFKQKSNRSKAWR